MKLALAILLLAAFRVSSATYFGSDDSGNPVSFSRVPVTASETLFYHPLNANVAPLTGVASNSYIGNFNHSYFASNGTWADAGHLTPAYSWNTNLFSYQYLNWGAAVNSGISGANASANRDLTQSEWVKSNMAAVFNQTGIDGVSSSCSALTNTAANGTCLYSITDSSSTRTFSAFLKRIKGYGRVWITRSNGTNWVDVTSQISPQYFIRVYMTTTLANPIVGFMMENSGDVIAVDAVNDTDTDHPSTPLIALASTAATTLMTYTNLRPDMVSARRYMASVLMTPNVDQDDVFGVGLQINSANSQNAVYAQVSPSSKVLALSTFSAGVLMYNVQPYITNTFFNGQTYKFQVIWGVSQIKSLMDGKLIAMCDNNSFMADPIQMDQVATTGTGAFSELKIEELHDNNIVLLGDSITVNASYTQLFLDYYPYTKYSFYQRGEGGDRSTNVIGRIASDLTPYYAPRAAANIVLLWVGSNDGGQNVTTANYISNMTYCVAQIKAGAPWRVFVNTVLPRSNGFENGQTTAGFEAWRNTVNAALPAIPGVERVISVGAVAAMADSTSLLYYGDGLHPTKQGYQAIFPTISQAVP